MKLADAFAEERLRVSTHKRPGEIRDCGICGPVLESTDAAFTAVGLEMDEMRKDRDRLDWLAANGGNILVHDSESGPFGFSSRRTRDSEWRTYTTLRAAIDGASACERLDALLNESHG